MASDLPERDDTPVAEPRSVQPGASVSPTLDRLTQILDTGDRAQTQAIIGEIVSEITMHHSGPLPSARELAAYRDIDPSFAERIVRMAEKEQERRHALPTEIMVREERLKARGQHYALVIAIVVLLFAAYLAHLGDTAMAGKVAIGTLIGLVGIFVGGRAIDAYGKRKDDDEED